MEFSVDKALFEQFPDLAIGVVIVQDVDNQGHAAYLLEEASQHATAIASPERQSVCLTERNRAVASSARRDEGAGCVPATEEQRSDAPQIRGFATEGKPIGALEALESDPRLRRWREAYRSFRAKPKKHCCSVESLYRTLLGGRALRSVNRLVDIYNFISIKHVIPVGGDDLDRIEGNIRLTHAQGTERFVALGANQPTSPNAGEVVYRDDHEILCRRWNWRECDKSKMTGETRRAVLFIEGLQPFSADMVRGIAEELGGAIRAICGGTVSSHLVTPAQPSLLVDRIHAG